MKKALTWEQLMEGFSEIRERQKESTENLIRLEKMYEKSKELHEKSKEENDKSFMRLEKLHEKSKEENDKGFKKLRDALDLTRQDLGGISDSNSKFSEEYFYNSLMNTMRFGDKKFDDIDDGLRRSKKMPDGSFLKGEYDVVMYNGDTVALIEVKYKVRKEDIMALKEKQVAVFKQLFPQYAQHKFYLGIAGLSFEPHTQKLAIENGIGILRPKGESIEVLDDNLIAY